MKKFYDCSNSPEAPSHHPENNGPKENDIVYGLKKYGYIFGWQCVDRAKDADILFTNDVYPAELLKLNKPKVKRMDGVYWYRDLVKRNEPLNAAAHKSDAVIFISKYSRDSYFKLYGSFEGNTAIANYNKSVYSEPLEDSKIIVNCVDDTKYFPMDCEKENKSLVASASNWIRPEKRFNDLMKFMSEVAEKYHLHLIGQCDMPVPSNVIKHGYVDRYTVVNEIMNKCEAMVNFSYRDACPKVVCQAVNCRLPVFYAGSGGTGEIVSAGVDITDEEIDKFENDVPELNIERVSDYWGMFRINYNMLREEAKFTKHNFMGMLSNYFNIFNSLR